MVHKDLVENTNTPLHVELDTDIRVFFAFFSMLIVILHLIWRWRT
jgi:hypothetical protein